MKKTDQSKLRDRIKALELELKEEKNKNSITTAILEGGNLIIWAVDFNQILISFNQNYYNFFMHFKSTDKVAIVKDEKILKLSVNDFWVNNYQTALSGESINLEACFEIKEEHYWKSIYLNPIYQLDGNISGVSAVAYDITDKMNSKLALFKSERMFRNIFESFQDLYFRCDFTGLITMLSPSVPDIIGYNVNELLGKNITNYYLYKTKTKSLLRKLATDKRVRNFEVDLVHNKGNIIHCICNVRLIYDEQNKPIFIEGVARDITELKEINKELIVAKETAEESLKVKDKFLANMSHEIRTPLNGIVGMIHLLDKPNLDPEDKKHYRSLKISSEILLNIVSDLLDISKIEAGKMTFTNHPVNTSEMIEKIQSLFQHPTFENNITFNTSIGMSVPEYIYADETKIIQIFSNLISNAIKFTPESGEIKVSLTQLERNIDGSVILEGKVTDTGIGMTDQDQNKLFKSFTQLDSSRSKSYKGTGLGLYISKQLVELYNGNIVINSTLNKGTEIKFTLKTTLTEKRPDQKTPETNILSAVPNILIVDDNEINLELANVILRNAGCNITSTQSGAESIELAASKDFDAILMDIQMPEVDGIMAIKAIHKKLKNNSPPIIAMTAYSLKGDKEKFLKHGFDDYISKPIRPDYLLTTLEKWTKGNLNKKNSNATVTENETHSSINQKVISQLRKYGGVETVKLALTEFDVECEKQIKESKSAFEEKNIEQILYNLHTLKGNAGTLGVDQIAKQAEKLESRVKMKNFSNFDSELTQLKQLHLNFKADLRVLFNQK